MNVLADAAETAAGRRHRPEPVRGRSGGPAGNARLTSWTGLALLGLLTIEGITLPVIGRLITVHLLVGAALIPPVLLKCASTGWRVLRYYTGDHDYVRAGPPPLLLRLLGPLVILTSLTVLGSGLGLILLRTHGLEPMAGLRVSLLTVHKASFVAWFAVMAVHVLARTVPALRIVRASGRGPDRVPGPALRGAVLAASLLAGIPLAAGVLAAASWWTTVWAHD